MFKIVVLNSEADWIEEKLIRLGKVFRKRQYKYVTVFKNIIIKDIRDHSNFIASTFLDVYERMPSSITNDLGNKTYVLDHKGNYYQCALLYHRPNYKIQYERYAKVKLYQLANIPQQDWIL